MLCPTCFGDNVVQCQDASGRGNTIPIDGKYWCADCEQSFRSRDVNFRVTGSPYHTGHEITETSTDTVVAHTPLGAEAAEVIADSLKSAFVKSKN